LLADLKASAIGIKSSGYKSINNLFPNPPPPKGCDQLAKIIELIVKTVKLVIKIK
jgi:hypothetical protein